jgi:hypothetical protein
MSISLAARLLRRVILVLSILFAVGQAGLDYDTYKVVKETIRVTRDGETRDSVRLSYALTRLGPVTLEASSLTLTSHGSYLSVLEEATLTGNVENRPRDITGDFLLQGTLPIPPLAAVHGLAALHGDTLFQARLRKAAYSLNDVFFDTATLAATLDSRVAFLQRLGDQSFEATFSKLTLGEPVRVRIAYDIPFPGAPGATLRVPVLFHPTGTPPRQCQITFFEAAEGAPPVQWLGPAGRVTLTTSGTHTFAYQDGFVLRRDEPPGIPAALQSTTLESGALKGNYLLFKAGLADSLMDELTQPLEVAFLWRWNPPYGFVEIRDGLKTLSPLGETVALEARAMREILLEMGPRGHRFGLLHSEPGRDVAFFPPAEAGSAGYRDLLAYLERFTEQRLYADYKDYRDDRPDWAITPWTDSGQTIRSRQEFLAALGRIRGGFSDRPGTLRHVEMLGFGSAPPTLIDLKDPKAVEAVLDSTTLANLNASWLGVDLAEAGRLAANAALRPLKIESPLAAGLPPLLFPVFRPSTVEYRAFTPARSHAVVMPFDVRSERHALIKSAGPFADSLQLQGIDALGRRTRVLTLRPRTRTSPDDTGLARLWAADPDRIAEASEADLGMRYGILTKGSYWGAGVGDAYLDPSGAPSVGLARLPKVVRGAGSPAAGFRVLGGHLLIADPGAGRASPGRDGARLDVFDPMGRLLLSLDLSRYRRDGGFAVPLEMLRRLAAARVVVVLRGAGRPVPFTLALGGRP